MAPASRPRSKAQPPTLSPADLFQKQLGVMEDFLGTHRRQVVAALDAFCYSPGWEQLGQLLNTGGMMIQGRAPTTPEVQYHLKGLTLELRAGPDNATFFVDKAVYWKLADFALRVWRPADASKNAEELVHAMLWSVNQFLGDAIQSEDVQLYLKAQEPPPKQPRAKPARATRTKKKA